MGAYLLKQNTRRILKIIIVVFKLRKKKLHPDSCFDSIAVFSTRARRSVHTFRPKKKKSKPIEMR